MTIMSKDSQQAPVARPDPLAQYPERYAMPPEEHQERYRRLTAAGHKVWPWKDDPTGLRDYEKATAGNKPKTDEEKHKEMAERKKDIEYERDHGEMRPKSEQYDESSQTEPPKKPPEDEPAEESEELREMRRLGGQRDVSPWGRNSPQPAMPLRGRARPTRYDEASQTEPPESSAPAPVEPPKQAPENKQPPQSPDLVLESHKRKVIGLSGGYLTKPEQDFVDYLLTRGETPHYAAASVQRKRKTASENRAPLQAPLTPAFPSVGRVGRDPGSISNSIIRQRNRGVPHLFESSIGGDASNYR